MILRFGPFELDPGSHELRRRGALVRLQQQPARVLTLLVERAGELLSREQIQRAVWDDGTHVDFDQGLNYCVKEIRAALGDDAEAPRYVETLPRRGYRFVAPVERRPPASEPDAASGTPAPPRPGLEGASRSRLRGRLLPWLALAAALPAVGTALLLVRPELRPPAAGRQMIAVLPFANLSADPEQDYLSEGLTEELIAQLGRLSPERIGVIARTSVMRYKDGRSDVEQIGRELRVGYLVEGSVRRGDDRLRISVSLVKVADRTQLWSETYEREPEDLLTLQGEVARSIARRVELALVPGAAQTRPPAPRDGVAYDLYLRGRFFWNRRDAEGLSRAVEYFERAIAREPGDARAWVGLADAWIVLGDHGHVPPRQALPAARRAAERALELDPTSAEALTSVAMIRGSFEWRWDEAVAGFEAAIRANPNYATAHHWFAHSLRARGRLQESLAQMRHALELDPLSVMINNNVGTALFHVGRLGEAEAHYRRSLEMDPGYCPAYWGLGRVAIHAGRVEEGLGLLSQANARCARQSQYAATLAWGHAFAGRQAEARRLRDALLAEARVRYVSSYELAVAQLAAGDREAALAGLEQAVEERQSGARVLRVDERLAGLRQEPRFAEVARRLGL